MPTAGLVNHHQPRRYRFGGYIARRQGGGPTSTGEPPGGMFAQPEVAAALPAAAFNLPEGMYYGTAPSWQTGGGPGTGEPDRPQGRPALYAQGYPTEEFAAANMGLPGRGWNPLGYTREGWDPDEAAAASPGFFRMSDIFARAGARLAPAEDVGPSTGRGGGGGMRVIPGQTPPALASGAGDLSTDNWRLLGMGPGWIMRNGYLIQASSPWAKQNYPARGPYRYDEMGQPSSPITGVYSPHLGPGEGFPASSGFGGMHWYWPGQAERIRDYPFVLT